MSNNVVKKYDAIDGLKVIGCLGVILVHVLTNGDYSLSANAKEAVFFGKPLLNLFFIVSAFGMCCGYFRRVLDNKINLTSFYKKRFSRVLPFFAILVLIDVCLKPSLAKALIDFS